MKTGPYVADSGEHGFTINGISETSAETFEVINPATGAAFARCPSASRDQLDRAVAAARRAFPAWSRLSFDARRELLGEFATLLSDNVEPIAALLTREQGKPLWQAKIEVLRTGQRMRELGSLEVHPQTLRHDSRSRIELHFRPLGVVGAIAPWNIPVNLALIKMTHALHTGNTVVIKPSPYTPLSTLMLGDLVKKVFPPGVVNIVAGGDQLGVWMTEHPDIDKITFTGSTATGKRVLAAAAGTMKRVTLELGGNDPAIVFPDCDVPALGARLFDAAFFNCGQACMAIKRLYVHESRYEEICEALQVSARDYRVGEGFEPGVHMGPLQNRAQYDKVLGLIQEVRGLPDARIIAGGNQLPRPGYFLEPTVVADIEEGTRLVDEEQFGPVLPVIRWSDEDEVIRRANATRFGLSASLWTRDIERGEALARRLEAGTVWINNHIGLEVCAPFGGAKESGLGREFSTLGLQSYMEALVVNSNRASS